MKKFISAYKLYSIWIGLFFLFFWPLLSFYTSIVWYWKIVIIVNIITFLFYLWDKGMAGGKVSRVPEKILLGLSLFGGVFISLLAQQLFRHKTKKKTFLIWNYLILLIYIGVIYLL